MRRTVSALADAPPRLRVGAEIMLACVVLVCAVLMVHGALKVAAARLGPRNEGVLGDRTGLFASHDPTETDCARSFSGLFHRIEVMPGATRVAALTSVPRAGSSDHSHLRVGESLASGTHAPLTRVVAAAACLILVALAACLVPALRALAVQPVRALRYE